ncbi:MAG: cyclopropane-fatty-acyl-phospholipid synthase family protein [Paracoccaceae bacterium]
MPDDIKTMKLYSAVERINTELEAQGLGDDVPLTVAQLTPYDQLHYFGTDAVDEAIAACGIDADARVLDIGSGFGGPARYLADTTGAHVDAVELQADMNAAASSLTRRCGLDDRVTHRQGDILQTNLEPAAYQTAVSWLALYHIPNRATLFPRIGAALRPGGMLFVEDLYCRAPLSAEEDEMMRTMLFSNTLPTQSDYVSEVATGGFTEITFLDMTETWAGFTRDRRDAFRDGRDHYVARHGQATYEALDAFYDCIAGLLTTGHVGGVKLTARRG